MPGIWTWRGSSSTARSGWVAADAAQQPCRFCLPSACELRSARAEERSHLGIIDRTGRTGADRATIPERARRSAAQSNRLWLRSNVPASTRSRAHPMVNRASDDQDAVIRKSRRPEYLCATAVPANVLICRRPCTASRLAVLPMSSTRGCHGGVRLREGDSPQVVGGT